MINTDLQTKIYRRVASLFRERKRGTYAVSSFLAQGPDVARYEVTFDPDKATEHISFAFQKLTEGTTYKDPTIEVMWEGIKKLAVRGGYHYMRSGMSWQAQVDNYLNVAALYDHNIHACDLEGINNTYSDTFFADVRRWIDAVRLATRQKVVLYTNLSTWTLFKAAILRIYSDGQQWLDSLDLWIAWPSETASQPPVDKWTFWQQSWVKPASEAGTGAFSDWNYFNGTEAQLYSWAGVTGEIPPPTGDKMQYKVVYANGVNRRTGPSTGYSTTGTPLKLGDVVDVLRDDIPDAADPTNTARRWVQFSDLSYGASMYDTVRMEKVVETPPPASGDIVANIILKADGTVTGTWTES